MKLYSIGTNEYEADVEKLIRRRLSRQEPLTLPIAAEKRIGGSFVTVGTDSDEERLALSAALAEVLTEDIRYFAIADMAAKLPFSPGEKRRILTAALENSCRFIDLSAVAARIFDYLSSNNTLILEGFLRFRMQDVLETWSVCVDAAAEQQILADEFRELSALIGLFAAFRPLEEPALTVVLHHDGSCTITEQRDEGEGFRIDCAPECGDSVTDLIRGMEPRSIRIVDMSLGKCEKLRTAISERFGALITDGE